MREDLARAVATRDYFDSSARFFDAVIAEKRPEPARERTPSVHERAVALSHAIGDGGSLRGLAPEVYLNRAAVSNDASAAVSGYTTERPNARKRAKMRRRARRGT